MTRETVTVKIAASMIEIAAQDIHAECSEHRDWETEAPTMKHFYRKVALAAARSLAKSLTEKLGLLERLSGRGA